ncbi:MAG: type IV secretion system protein [Gammaproteobacteria bacterium]|jgi:type IV secretion system protein TrbL
MLDPSAISIIQATFLTHIAHAFHVMTHYASNLLFIFAVFEIVVFGLLYALGQNDSWGALFFKVIKIGLIFFIIQNYTWLLHTVVSSFAQIGGVVADTSDVSKYIFNPALIWQFGYNIGIGLLKVSIASSSVGLVILLVTLGFGILFIFGLIGIQIVVQLVGFYLVSLVALIMLPFGVFSPSSGMFDRSVQAVLKAGVRVAVLIVIIGVAITVWQMFALPLDITKDFNLNQILGIFFSSLLFLYLAVKLPAYAATGIGLIVTNKAKRDTAVVNVSTQQIAGGNTVLDGGLSSVRAAAMVEPSYSFGNNMASGSNANNMTTTQIQAASGSVSSGSPLQQSGSIDNLRSANVIEKSISDATLQKLKRSFIETIKENKSN